MHIVFTCCGCDTGDQTTGQPFGHYFDASERYGLVGKTPEVKMQLSAHRRSNKRARDE